MACIKQTQLIVTEISTNRQRFIIRIARAGGLDAHVISTILFRVWSILAGGLTALFIPTFLSPEQQGYYFTFIAVMATQVFFELGLNQVLIQLTSHAAAHIKKVNNYPSKDDARWQHAIVSLIKISTKWNAVMAVLFFFSLLFVGTWFFSHKGNLPTEQWLTPWFVLISATALNLLLSARLAICEGLGEVGQVARLRLRQSIAGYALLWLLLVSGTGLWATIAISVSNMIGTVWWLRQRKLVISLTATERPRATLVEVYSYGNDIFPLQWRIALSWVSGYFIFSFLTPVVFAHQGEVEAGRLGLGLTIFSAITTVGYSWISAKIPTLSGHIAREERAELNALFNKQATRAIGATVFCASCFLVSVQFSGHLVPEVLERLPPMTVLLILYVTTITNTALFSMAAYMRAHKEEPLVAQSITSALLIGIGALIMAPYGMIATVSAYAAVNLLVALPWCTLIFSRYRQREK
jgi:hypothetical protein